jgi:GT2 family glycosyltransferase
VDPFRDPAVGVVGGKIASVQPSSSLVEAFLAQVKKSDGSQFQKTEPMAFPGGNVAYRATALQKVGIFDAAMPGGGDVDLAWRVQAYAGYKGVFAAQAVVYHKHRSSLTGVFRQYRRYGCSEIVLTTLYRNETFHCRTPKSQLRTMARQVRALCTYPVSFLVRLTRWRSWQADRLYLVWPVLRFVLELGSLAGKIEGLVRTRCFRRNPYPTDAKQVKRKPSASPSSDTVGSRARELAA